MDPISTRFADERTKRSNVLLLVFGLLLIVAYLVNSVVIYDDLYIPAYFSGLVQLGVDRVDRGERTQRGAELEYRIAGWYIWIH